MGGGGNSSKRFKESHSQLIHYCINCMLVILERNRKDIWIKFIKFKKGIKKALERINIMHFTYEFIRMKASLKGSWR